MLKLRNPRTNIKSATISKHLDSWFLLTVTFDDGLKLRPKELTYKSKFEAKQDYQVKYQPFSFFEEPRWEETE